MVNLGVPVFMVICFVTLIAVLFASGMLTRYPYTCILRIPRQGGGYKPIILPGRSVKNGKIEMRFGLFDKLQVAEPSEDCTEEGRVEDSVKLPGKLKFVKSMNSADVLEGVMNSKEEVTWFKSVDIDETEIKFKALVPENAQLAYAVAFESDWNRTHKMKSLEKYLPAAAIIICAFMVLGMGWIVMNGFKDLGAQFHGDYADFASKLANSTVVVHTTTAATVPTTPSGFPNAPTGTTPPPG